MEKAGEWDRAGALAKRALCTHQIQHPEDELANTHQCVEFMKRKFSIRVLGSSDVSNEVPISRVFWNIGIADVNRVNEWKCHTIPGSRQFHSVLGRLLTDPTLLLVLDLTCFCPPCIKHEWVNCEQKSNVSSWRIVRLRPFNIVVVQEQIEAQDDPEDWLYEDGDEENADVLQIGDNFMIPTFEGNAKGVDFYVLQCTKVKFELQEDFVCPWGERFQKGDWAVVGTYYQKYGRASNTFVYLDRSPVAYVFAHHMRAVRFPMVLAQHVVRGNVAIY